MGTCMQVFSCLSLFYFETDAKLGPDRKRGQEFRKLWGKYMNSLYYARRDLLPAQWGATVVEYTLMVGIVATVGICAIRTIGNSIAGSADPCNPGVIVRAAQILGGLEARERTCKDLPVP